MTTLPLPETPLYNHSLPAIETWLRNLGSIQDLETLNCWSLQQTDWSAEIELGTDQIVVCYRAAGEAGQDLTRAYKYSLSRADLEAVILGGP